MIGRHEPCTLMFFAQPFMKRILSANFKAFGPGATHTQQEMKVQIQSVAAIQEAEIAG